MERKKIYTKPFDACHYMMFNEFPKEYTATLGIPGKFVKKINRRVNLKDGSSGFMDSSYIAEPDNEILTQKVAVNLEHQTAPINKEKLEKIGKYDIQLVINEHLPTFSVIATHTNKELSKNLLISSPSDITKLYFLNLNEENICQRLNTVEQIINNNKHINIENALNLGIIGLYAPRKQAQKIIKKIIQLYIKIADKLDYKTEYVLYFVLNYLTDAFITEEKEYRRLINMVKTKTSEKLIEEFESTKCLKEDLKYMEEDLSTTKKTLYNTKKDLINTKKDLSAANDEISQLKAENEKLKKKELDK